MKQPKYRVLLYYKYVEIADPDTVREEQRAICQKLGLKGRIIIAHEGINGTVEGTIEATDQYREYMNQSEYFSDISFKQSDGTGESFPKLSVRSRPEIVTAGMPALNPMKTTGKYISADELHEWFETGKEFYIVDMRNDYEYASGYFENFIPSGLDNFFNLKDTLPRLNHLKNKTVVTVCTGGIRCEKASGFLLENGFSDVYQLQEGIHTYIEKYPNKHFKGKLYVFDKRLTIAFNTDSPEHEIVGNCDQCGVKADTYVNCEYDICHRHYICCMKCRDADTGLAFCNEFCREMYLKAQVPLTT